MNENIDNILKQISIVFAVTDKALNDWNTEGNLQFPLLLKTIASKMNWDEKQIREVDPIIRYYLRRHPGYHITRGVHGGIMRDSDKQKREAIRNAKDSVKKQMQKALDDKIAILSVSSEDEFT